MSVRMYVCNKKNCSERVRSRRPVYSVLIDALLSGNSRRLAVVSVVVRRSVTEAETSTNNIADEWTSDRNMAVKKLFYFLSSMQLTEYMDLYRTLHNCKYIKTTSYYAHKYTKVAFTVLLTEYKTRTGKYRRRRLLVSSIVIQQWPSCPFHVLLCVCEFFWDVRKWTTWIFLVANAKAQHRNIK